MVVEIFIVIINVFYIFNKYFVELIILNIYMNLFIQVNQRFKYYFVLFRMISESDVDKRFYSDNINNVVFYVNFVGFLFGKKIK